MQTTQVYNNVIEAVVCNSMAYDFQLPIGKFDGESLLKKIWFKIQKKGNSKSPDIQMQRAMWLSPCRFDGSALRSMDMKGQWWDTGMELVAKRDI